ncbi:50S ribosomal protein L24 [Blattabacterium cuenoti]|uniref:50S ribosomal protein L24 n=1 Tax=Blattabacterium cuenoti TaxID=1653831 RepID=UPI00163D20B3|nr:50S ribosomal protein L24 [Blattabacterium cuenoti]
MIKKGDKVLILSGNYKKNTGIVLKVFLKKNKAIIEGINIVKKHIKPSSEKPKGEIIKKELPIHLSNLKKI